MIGFRNTDKKVELSILLGTQFGVESRHIVIPLCLKAGQSDGVAEAVFLGPLLDVVLSTSVSGEALTECLRMSRLPVTNANTANLGVFKLLLLGLLLESKKHVAVQSRLLGGTGANVGPVRLTLANVALLQVGSGHVDKNPVPPFAVNWSLAARRIRIRHKNDVRSVFFGVFKLDDRGILHNRRSEHISKLSLLATLESHVETRQIVIELIGENVLSLGE